MQFFSDYVLPCSTSPSDAPGFYMDRYLRAEIPDPVIGDWAEPPPNDGLGVGPGPKHVKLSGEALRSCRAGYYGLINHVDDQINRILGKVRGIDAMTDGNTVVVFLSDHGEMLGDHYLYHKRLPYEPSSRIPLIIRAPEYLGIQQAAVCDKPVCLEDVMPTVLDMAGADCPDSVDGHSLLPLLRGEDPRWRSYLHLEHAPIHQSLTDGKEKFIWFVKDGREQFFDLLKDPKECHNLINDSKESARISRWRNLLIQELKDRPEGFSNGKTLIPGRPYPAVLPHASKIKK